MMDLKDTMVMVTREEFEELIKLRVLKANAKELYNPKTDLKFSCVDVMVLRTLFPDEFPEEEEKCTNV